MLDMLMIELFVLQDQYDQLHVHTQKGIEFLEKYGHFVDARTKIEQEYAYKLRWASCGHIIYHLLREALKLFFTLRILAEHKVELKQLNHLTMFVFGGFLASFLLL